MEGKNYFDYLLVFVDTCEDLVMADDVATPSNLPIVPVEKEELEESSLDMNVFQQSREEEPSRWMVCTWVDRSACDCRFSPNPHALTIYLEFFLVHGIAPKRFEER